MVCGSYVFLLLQRVYFTLHSSAMNSELSRQLMEADNADCVCVSLPHRDQPHFVRSIADILDDRNTVEAERRWAVRRMAASEDNETDDNKAKCGPLCHDATIQSVRAHLAQQASECAANERALRAATLAQLELRWQLMMIKESSSVGSSGNEEEGLASRKES